MDSVAARILFVDDERNVLKSLERLFLDEKYRVFTADSGQAGLRILEEFGPFHVVISDFRMPVMNGVEFLSEVCRRWPDTERMILSGYADTAAIVSAINLGQIYKFVAKPWQDEELMGTVREALERYELRTKNRQLVTDLLMANEELKKINERLNDMVEERFREALLNSKALHSFQNVMDALPIGVIGADGYGMVVQCNQLGSEILASERKELIGCDLSSIFPLHLVRQLIELEGNSCGKCVIELPGGKYCAHLSRLSSEDQKAIVIALLNDDIPLEVCNG